jgi:hypothetical protein
MAKRTTASKSPEASIQGYFKRILKENPKLLKGRSNEELLRRWQEDHPGEELTRSVKIGAQSAKGVLRSKRRRRARKSAEEPSPLAAAAVRPSDRRKGHDLETLEEQIDDCLSLAKQIDREGLQEVIRQLRKARNEVVWKAGQ